LTLAGRHELHGSAGGGSFSPTAATGFWVNSRLKLRASLSRAFRLPAFTELYYHDPANRGSPDLSPESAWSYEAGADWRIGPHLDGSLAVFERRETDGIDFVQPTSGGLWRARNFRSLRFTGVEAAAGVTPARRQRLEFRYAGLRAARRW